jgi:hypothetical protein
MESGTEPSGDGSEAVASPYLVGESVDDDLMESDAAGPGVPATTRSAVRVARRKARPMDRRCEEETQRRKDIGNVRGKSVERRR